MIVQVCDRSYKNAIRWFGEARFTEPCKLEYKGEKYRLVKLPASNVINVCMDDEMCGEVIEISYHNADRMLHQIQVRWAFPNEENGNEPDEKFFWEALYAALRHVGYVGFNCVGEDDEYDYCLLIAMQPFPESISV